jgi:hypothetical protein
MLDRDILTAALDAPDRSRIEALVEGLIGYLDSLDTDPDLEEDDFGGGDVNDEPHDEEPDREPSLGWANDTEQVSSRSFFGNATDLEAEHDGSEPDDDGIGDMDGLQEQTNGEPNLGSFDRMMDQTKSWRQHCGRTMGWGHFTDAEQDDADREDGDPEEDDGTAEDDLRRLPRAVWAETGQPVTFVGLRR